MNMKNNSARRYGYRVITVLILLGLEFQVSGQDTFRFRLATDPPTLDPAQSTDTTSGAVVLKVFDGLVEFDPLTLEVVPAVAESFHVSEDGRIYTFHLRKGVSFHNGRPVVAEDIKYSLERTLDPQTKSPRTWVLNPIEGAREFTSGQADHVAGIRVVGESTVQLILTEPYAPFLAQLCMEAASLLPREECERWGDEFKSHPVGCGPFEFVEWQHDIRVVVKANPNYYGGVPRLKRVEFKVIPNEATAFEEYKAGGLDFLDQVPPGQLLRVRQQYPEDLHIWPYLSIYYIGFNHLEPPFRDNVLLRRAVNYAVDKEKICLAVKEGISFPARGILPPGIPGYNPGLEGYPYNPRKAGELLAEAGYPGGSGLPEITLWHNRDDRHRLIGECIQYYLGQIGIRIRLKNVEWAAYLEACEEGRPLLYRMGWVADYPDADNFLYILLHSSQAGSPGNYARYSNPEFDELVVRAQASTDPETRVALYRKAESIAVEDAAWLYVYYDREVALIKPFWENIILSPQGDFTIPLHVIRHKDGPPP
ncbi:ABC transporter substrate-binding protein [bacterium]|nr:ABC transporter substrate-binding protein [candidate division CSSED10-310 bacterium]